MEKVRRAKQAVLVIDMQNDYVHRQGAVQRYFRSKKDGRNLGAEGGATPAELMAPRLAAFITAAREMATRVIWIRTVNDEMTQSPLAAAQGKRFAWAGDEWGTAFYEGLVPEAEEAVVTKHRHSAFFETDLDLILRRQAVETLILTGVSTPYCVESTARDAFARDYNVVTVADCTASKVAGEHEKSLARLGRTFGCVSLAAEIIESWRTA
ncbi:MAG TPA: cysteine hydrolase [Candidatus Binatia bacterium]|nr:cysteine hydrolase [Candidatus Binatia bacterium]